MKIKSTYCKSFYSDRLSNTKYQKIYSFAQNLIIQNMYIKKHSNFTKSAFSLKLVSSKFTLEITSKKF